MNKKIHIVHVVLSLEPGGLENGVVNIVNGLDKEKFKSTICCLKSRGSFADRINENEVYVHVMNMADGNDYGLVFRLAYFFHKVNADIVHTRNPKPYLYGFPSAKLAGIRSIVHSEHGRVLPGKRYRMLIERFYSRFTDSIIAMSNDLRNELVKHVGMNKEKIEVIYNGVDFDRFSFKDKSEIKTKLTIGNDKLVIGSVGRLASVKNYELLISAVASLDKEINIVLVLVGDGPERDSLEKCAMEYLQKDCIIFLGHQDKVENIIPVFDIFVLPSLSEGVSNTLLESMAAGNSVIASNVGGNKEVIINGKTGLLFTSEKLESLVHCIRKFALDSKIRAKISSSGKESVKERFCLSRMVKDYERVYLGVYNK